MQKIWILSAAVAGLGVALMGCANGGGAATAEGASDVTGTVTIDGSGTVYPIAQIMGEDFKAEYPNVDVSVNKSGTGSGMQKFIRGESDIATASRPIEAEEIASLKDANMEFIEIPVAIDGLTVVVSKENTFAKGLTKDQLQKIWAPDSRITNWNQIDPSFPNQKLTLYGPTDNHGTFEYFTEAVVGKKNQIRTDYQPNQEYNAIIQAVAADKGGMAFLGYNYFEENQDKVRPLAVNGVEPSESTIEGGTYTPLSRPLFLYVNKAAYNEKPAVRQFVEFALDAGLDAVVEAKYVKLPDSAYTAVRANVKDQKTGSFFVEAEPGRSVEDVLASTQPKS